MSQNEKLTFTLREAWDHIAALRDEVDKLTQPPAAHATAASINDDGTVDVRSSRPQDAPRCRPASIVDDLRQATRWSSTTPTTW